MLPSQNRLKKRKEFAYIYKNGKKINSKNLSLVFVSSKKMETRIGISVSNKVGKAVSRNKIKRQIREVIRFFLKNLKNHQNFILVAKPSITSCCFEDIKKEVFYLLNKGNLFKNEQNNKNN